MNNCASMNVIDIQSVKLCMLERKTQQLNHIVTLKILIANPQVLVQTYQGMLPVLQMIEQALLLWLEFSVANLTSALPL